MPHNSRPNVTNVHAADRYTRLRAAGVPAILNLQDAWYLTGGVVGTRDHTQTGTLTLAYIARRVPDCEHFLPDYWLHKTELITR